jgi:hypothetical protein
MYRPLEETQQSTLSREKHPERGIEAQTRQFLRILGHDRTSLLWPSYLPSSAYLRKSLPPPKRHAE